MTPWVSARSDGSPPPIRFPSGSSRAARWPYRRMDCARLTAPTTFWSGTPSGTGSSSVGGVQRSNRARVSASTAAGSRRYFSVQLEHVAAIQPRELLPACHGLILPLCRAPIEPDGGSTPGRRGSGLTPPDCLGPANRFAANARLLGQRRRGLRDGEITRVNWPRCRSSRPLPPRPVTSYFVGADRLLGAAAGLDGHQVAIAGGGDEPEHAVVLRSQLDQDDAAARARTGS